MMYTNQVIIASEEWNRLTFIVHTSYFYIIRWTNGIGTKIEKKSVTS
jgi:hypothetical protein